MSKFPSETLTVVVKILHRDGMSDLVQVEANRVFQVIQPGTHGGILSLSRRMHRVWLDLKKNERNHSAKALFPVIVPTWAVRLLEERGRAVV